MKSAPTIVLELRASRALQLGVLVVGGLALAAISLAGVSIAIRVLLAAVAIGVALRTAAQLRSRAVTRMVLAPAGTWQLETTNGPLSAMELTHSAEVGPLVALTFAGAGTSRRLVLLPDSCDREDLRRLRVWLRHGGAETARPRAIQ